MNNQGKRDTHREENTSRRVVIELLALVAAGLFLSGALTSMVFQDSWSSHVWIVLAGFLAGLAIPVGAAISVLRRTPVFLTHADRVTLGRGALAGGCAALAVFICAGLLPSQSWLIVLLAAPAALLDAVDGWVARRTGNANAYGARLDMETDAAFLMVLSIPAAFVVGPWVLCIGAMRYLFVAAAWLRPALAGKLEFSQFRRIVAAIQSAVLVVVVAPVIPVVLATVLAGVALMLLAVSFGKDIYTLERQRTVVISETGKVRRPTLSRKQKVWRWFSHVLALAVAAEFIKEAFQKFAGAPAALAPFLEFGWPVWFVYVIAVTEVLAALLLVVPGSRVFGALLLAGVMLGAVFTNLVNGHPDFVWLNLLLLAATGFLMWQSARFKAQRSP